MRACGSHTIFLLTAAIVLLAGTAFSTPVPKKDPGRDRGGPVAAFARRALESRRSVTDRDLRPHGILTVQAPLREDFETPLFPPAGWTIGNPEPSSITWEFAAGVSGYGSGSGAAWLDFYSYEVSPGDRDDLRTPVIMGLTAGDSLTFDYAYAEYDDPFYGPDSLLVLVSVNGGATFSVTLFAEGGAALATAAASTLPFAPLPSEWRTLRFPLPPSVAGSSVVIAFTGVNGFSNNLYLDNIFAGSVPANDIQALRVLSPVPDSKQRTSFVPLGIVRNAGTAAQSSVPVRFQVLAPGGGMLYNNQQAVGALAAGETDTVAFPLYTVPASPGAYTVRCIALNSGDVNPANDTVVTRFFRPAALSGVLTVGSGGVLPSLRAAVDTLNRSDVAGPLTFRLVSPVYNETGPLTISAVEGTGVFSGVTFTPAPGLAVSVNVPGTPEEPYALAIRGSSFIALDGGEPPSSLTVEATGIDGAAALYIAGLPGRSSSSNTLRNLVLRTAADSSASSSGFYGILFAGYDDMQKDSGNAAVGCMVTRHGQAGIAAQNTHGLRIESCIVRDWVQQGGFTDVRGIWLASGAVETVLRGNTIGNIRNAVNGWWAFGIHHDAGAGSSLLCSSNSIGGIGSTGGGSDPNFAAGIWSSSALNSGDRYYFNSVCLSGTESSTSTGSRSAAWEFAAPAPPGLRMRNNIGVNRTVHGGGGPLVRAYAVYRPEAIWAPQDTCDRNIWWTPDAGGAIGYFGGAVRGTLAAWQAATGQDGSSISADPRFVSAADLHVALGTSPAGGAAVPVAGEGVDIDGENRDPLTPDIGSDEFPSDHIAVPVLLTSGWNMIANPVDVAAGQDSVRRLFPGALFPYAFSFSPASGYRQEVVLGNRKGFWEKFEDAGTAHPAGGIRLRDTIEVLRGWNMVGSIAVAVDTGSIGSSPAGLRISPWYGYSSGYSAVDTLLPGKGFWVKARDPGMFILQGAPPVRRGIEKDAEIRRGLSR